MEAIFYERNEKIVEITIEKNVPVHRRGCGKGWAELLEKMEDGDSFVLSRKFMELKDVATVRSTILKTARHLGLKIFTRYNLKDGLRIWRIGPDLLNIGKELLTPADLAQYMRVRRVTIAEWARKGKLPCVEIEGRVRFDPKTIWEYLRKNTHLLKK